MGEFEFIGAIANSVVRRPDRVALGIGDDAAIFHPTAEPIVIACDTLNEGVHFRLDWSSVEDVAYKAIAVNMSDLAAMGAKGDAVFLSLSVPPTLSAGQLEGLRAGLQNACETWNLELAGGDTTRSAGGLSLTVTIVGRAGMPMRRDAAMPGDQLVVTGPIGWAGWGLAALSRGAAAPPEAFARHRRGVAREQWGSVLAERGVRAAIDISDGLLQDAGHLAHRSGLRVRVWLHQIPLPPNFERAAVELGLGDAPLAAATAGDDFELAFAAPGSWDIPVLAQQMGAPLAVVGRFESCTPGESPGVVPIGAAGEALKLQRLGYTHF